MFFLLLIHELNVTNEPASNVTRKDMNVCGHQNLRTKRGDLLSIDLNVTLLENEVLADHPLPDVLHIINDSLKVRRRIIGAGDEDAVGLAGRRGGIDRGDRDEPERRKSVCTRTGVHR